MSYLNELISFVNLVDPQIDEIDVIPDLSKSQHFSLSVSVFVLSREKRHKKFTFKPESTIEFLLLSEHTGAF